MQIKTHLFSKKVKNNFKSWFYGIVGAVYFWRGCGLKCVIGARQGGKVNRSIKVKNRAPIYKVSGSVGFSDCRCRIVLSIE